MMVYLYYICMVLSLINNDHLICIYMSYKCIRKEYFGETQLFVNNFLGRKQNSPYNLQIYSRKNKHTLFKSRHGYDTRIYGIIIIVCGYIVYYLQIYFINSVFSPHVELARMYIINEILLYNVIVGMYAIHRVVRNIGSPGDTLPRKYSCTCIMGKIVAKSIYCNFMYSMIVTKMLSIYCILCYGHVYAEFIENNVVLHRIIIAIYHDHDNYTYRMIIWFKPQIFGKKHMILNYCSFNYMRTNCFKSDKFCYIVISCLIESLMCVYDVSMANIPYGKTNNLYYNSINYGYNEKKLILKKNISENVL